MRGCACAGEADTAFKGFHRIERALYRDNVTDASAPLLLTDIAFSAWATGLVASYEELGEMVSTVCITALASGLVAVAAKTFIHQVRRTSAARITLITQRCGTPAVFDQRWTS